MKKLFGLLVLFVLVSGCGNQTSMVDQAKEQALSLVEGSTFRSLEVVENTIQVLVENQEGESLVVINEDNGELISIERLQVLEETTPVVDETTGSEIASAVGGNVDREQAIELANNHLLSIGISNASLAYAYSDNDEGIQVWSIEFVANGVDYEFYVRKDNGSFVKAPGL